MVIVLEKHITPEQKQEIRTFLEKKGYQIREIVGQEETIFGAVGIPRVDPREVELLPGVQRVIPISKPFKLASRELKKDDTIVPVGPIKVGGKRIVVIAGPCAVESREQILETARIVRASGAVMLRGGAFKPRTSPYAFQGLGEDGLRYMKEAGEAVGMPIVTEVVSTEYVELIQEYADVFQIGARNMQNFELLKKVGRTGRPVILKRGLAATIEEWLMAAEYLLAHGTDNVILCERGIRTFETYTRNTLDISAIPVIKKLSHLPIIVDPSHATGIREKVPPMALAAIAAGADGLIVEVHPDPAKALSDGAQTLFPDQFEKLMRDIEVLAPVVDKEIAKLPSLLLKTKLKDGSPEVTTQGALLGRVHSIAVDTPIAQGLIPKVSFQGEQGAYSEMAIRNYFHFPVETLPQKSFQDVFNTVLEGRVQYGMVPLENSLAGSIHENYDLFLRYPDIKIVGETKLRIVHSLIGLPGATLEGVRKVFSHPQGLAQCAQFLEEHPYIEKVPFYDTAGSVVHIAKEGKKEYAAIAHEGAAVIYGMKVLKTGIETNPLNYTRFAVLSRSELEVGETPNKASIVFSTPDKPGSLFKCMKVLAVKNLNMKKLESRPIPGKPWQYMFYVDIELPEDMDIFKDALEEIRSISEEGVRVLGMYRVSEG
ncbi:MAG TPA: 3-deoxy-7-phosphoheptulonate synthase [Spirochaetales bacterium]|nr:3-deoxy-7-phosphoheptulonate synthase [Spirochaetales bacterium]HOV37215.1 3-deoxy-7-phosphoheptulonate synthase [Spirochaetales bacterium]